MRAAAISMDMAYSKAWTMVRSCEEALEIKLLQSSTGGRNGGGAVLTPEAKQLLQRYVQYCNTVNEFAVREFEKTFGSMVE